MSRGTDALNFTWQYFNSVLNKFYKQNKTIYSVIASSYFPV